MSVGGLVAMALTGYFNSDSSRYIYNGDMSRDVGMPVPGTLPSTTNLLEFAEKTDLSAPIGAIIDILEIRPDVLLEQPTKEEIPAKRRRPPGRSITPTGSVEMSFGLSNGADVVINENTGELIYYDSGESLYYYKNGHRRAQPKLLETPLSESQFMDVVNKLLSAEIIFGTENSDVSIVMEQSVIELAPAQRPLTGSSLFKGGESIGAAMNVWRFSAPKTYKGHEYKYHYPAGAGVTIEVDNETAEVLRIANSSLVLPDNVSENISQEKALGIAQSFGERRGIAADGLKIRKLIVHPTNQWKRFRGRKGWLPITKLCWVVTWCYQNGNDTTYSVEDDSHIVPERVTSVYLNSSSGTEVKDATAYQHEGPYVYIDVKSGEIVGGWNGEKWVP